MVGPRNASASGARGERLADLASERGRDALVGVNVQDPLPVRRADPRVADLREVRERLDQHGVGVAPRDLLGPVGRAVVDDDDDLVAEAERAKGALDHLLLVPGGEHR